MTTDFPIGQQIRELRTALGITHRELAPRVGLSITYLSFIENGKPATAQQIQKIEAALGYKLDDPRVKQLFTILASLRGQNGDTPQSHGDAP